MSLYLNTGLSFALIVLLLKYIESKRFCEAFAENGFKISYAFRRVDPKSAENCCENYLLIDKLYWRLQFTDDKLDHRKDILIGINSTESNGFGNQYSMAFSDWDTKVQDSRPGLLNTEKTSIDWFELMDKSQDILNVTNKPKETKAITFPNDFNPSMAYVPNWGQESHNLVVFIQKSQHKGYDWKIYRIENGVPKEDWKTGIDSDDLIKIEPWPLNTLPENSPSLIAVLGQFSNINEKNRKPWGYGLILLFKDDKRIKSCYAVNDKIEKTCEKGYQILADCSDTQLPATTTTNPNDESSLYLILLVLALITLAFLIAGAVLMVLMYRNNQKEEERRKKLTTTRSGEDGFSTGSAVPKK